jgi:hypothetical protein
MGNYMKKQELTPQQLRILYVLKERGGKASFNHMLTEAHLDAAMFLNNAKILKRKRLVSQGETFDVFIITEKGELQLREALEKVQ